MEDVKAKLTTGSLRLKAQGYRVKNNINVALDQYALIQKLIMDYSRGYLSEDQFRKACLEILNACSVGTMALMSLPAILNQTDQEG